MKRFLIGICCLLITSTAFAGTARSTVDFIQVLNGNLDEARYYYLKNWQALRKQAKQRNFIESWQLLETKATTDTPFHFMLITTYADDEQYKQREDNFQSLIKEAGPLKLLNDKKTGEFRKTLYTNDAVSLNRVDSQ